ncbi:MAG: hypothetical protein ACKO4S_00760 [Snowella sp.]|jgi:hypothetical protein
MITQTKNLSEITQQAIDVLFKEVGVANTIRFLNQFSTSYGNYTEERENLFEDLTLNEILAQLKNLTE